MKRSIIAVLVLLVGMLGTVRAQDGGGLTGDQRAALDVVNEAITNMISQESYHVTGQSSSTQTTQVKGLPVLHDATDFTLDADIRLSAFPQSVSAQGGFTSHITHIWGEDQPAPVTIVFEFVLTNDSLYERFDLQLASLDLPNNLDASLLALKNQWLELSHEGMWDVLKSEYGFEAMSFQSTLSEAVSPRPDGGYTVGGALTGPLAEAALFDIVELGGETLDGQPMRVFELSLDPLYWMVEGMKASPLTNADPTADLDAATIQTLTAWLREHIDQQQRIWIGVEDHLIHQIETHNVGGYHTGEMRDAIPALADSEAWSGQEVAIDFDYIMTTTYTNFGVPVEIVAPEEAVPFVDQFARSN